MILWLTPGCSTPICRLPTQERWVQRPRRGLLAAVRSVSRWQECLIYRKRVLRVSFRSRSCNSSAACFPLTLTCAHSIPLFRWMISAAEFRPLFLNLQLQTRTSSRSGLHSREPSATRFLIAISTGSIRLGKSRCSVWARTSTTKMMSVLAICLLQRTPKIRAIRNSGFAASGSTDWKCFGAILLR